MNKYDIKYIFKKVLIFFIIFIILSFTKSCEVHAETMNPRYATIQGNYLWQDSKMLTGNRYVYGVTNNSNTKLNFCISPTYQYNFNEEGNYYYAEIEVCSAGYPGQDGFWQSGGTGYATLDGWLDTTTSCSTGEYTGHIVKSYVHLIDWTTPSGGADFSWSCFQLANDNANSGYYNVARVNNIILTDKSYYKQDKERQEELLLQQQQLNNQNTQINQNNTIINQNNDMKDTITNDNVDGANSQVDDLLNNSAFNDSSGIQSIINAPLNFINGLTNSCSPIKITIPYINSELSIPCIKQELTNHIPTLVPILSTAINGFVIYRILLDIVYLVKSSRNPDDDRIEVLDL